MQRVLVLGCSGAGKSTLSGRLARATGLPRFELDGHFWRSGWVTPPRDEWRVKVAELCARPAWIIDGNYSSTFDIRLPRADTVIWLDYPTHLCLRRVLGRVVRDYGRVRHGLPEGCPKHFSLTFFKYIWNFNTVQRPRMRSAIEQFGAYAEVHMLASDRDAERLFAEFAALDQALVSASPPQPPIPR